MGFGDGEKLPQGPSSGAVEFNESLDPPEVADSVELYGGPAEFQYDFEVEPLALEKTGEYVPLDDVSYKPAEGWTFDAIAGALGIQPTYERAAASGVSAGIQRKRATQPLNGFANANIIAIPTPIRKAASIRPASRNILVCSSFISSG